jgi:hypothetical protein
MDTTQDPNRGKRWLAGAAIATGGLLAGAALAGSLSASAADSSSSSPAPSNGSTAAPTAPSSVDESKSQRPDEQLLTGDTADKVKAAALAKYPGATILRVETDSDGVYEAHMTKADGTRVTVEVGKDFAVTGEEAGGPGGPGGHGPQGPPPASGSSAPAA